MLICSSVEAGLVALQKAMLERSLDLTVRDLRIGILAKPTHVDLKASICSNVLFIPNCRNALLLELQTVPRTTWAMPANGTHCVDLSKDVQPVTTFLPGLQNEIVVIRACVKIRPFFPGTAPGLHLPTDAAGMYALVGTSAFVNEPRL